VAYKQSQQATIRQQDVEPYRHNNKIISNQFKPVSSEATLYTATPSKVAKKEGITFKIKRISKSTNTTTGGNTIGK
jgi:hypothetical protein